MTSTTGAVTNTAPVVFCALAIVLATATLACDGKTPSSPTPSPSPTPTSTPAEQSVSLSGTVTSEGGPLQNARVEIIGALNAGRFTVTDSVGKYRMTELKPGVLTIRVSASECFAQTSTFTLAADSVTDVALLRIPSSSAPFKVVDALTSAGLVDVLVTIPGGSTVSDPGGDFLVQLPAEGSGVRSISLSKPGFVSRETYLQFAESGNTFSMIPSSFNLSAFNEILRHPFLHRWRSEPRLVIENCTLTFITTTSSSAPCTSDGMSDDEHAGMVADLEWSLPRLSGEALAGFSSTTRQRATTGATVLLLNPGQITVARIAGLTAGSTFWGYGRYFLSSTGEVTAGIVMIDRDFDRSGSAFRRSLRAHELGHAMGYDHSSMTSVMNSSARFEPTTFDLQAFRIAFQRQPGNTAPDVDPSFESGVARMVIVGWSAPIR